LNWGPHQDNLQMMSHANLMSVSLPSLPSAAQAEDNFPGNATGTILDPSFNGSCSSGSFTFKKQNKYGPKSGRRLKWSNCETASLTYGARWGRTGGIVPGSSRGPSTVQALSRCSSRASERLPLAPEGAFPSEEGSICTIESLPGSRCGSRPSSKLGSRQGARLPGLNQSLGSRGTWAASPGFSEMRYFVSSYWRSHFNRPSIIMVPIQSNSGPSPQQQTQPNTLRVLCDLRGWRAELKDKQAFLVAYDADQLRSVARGCGMDGRVASASWVALECLCAEKVPLKHACEEVSIKFDPFLSAKQVLLRIGIGPKGKPLSDWTAIGDSVMVRLSTAVGETHADRVDAQLPGPSEPEAAVNLIKQLCTHKNWWSDLPDQLSDDDLCQALETLKAAAKVRGLLSEDQITKAHEDGRHGQAFVGDPCKASAQLPQEEAELAIMADERIAQVDGGEDATLVGMTTPRREDASGAKEEGEEDAPGDGGKALPMSPSCSELSSPDGPTAIRQLKSANLRRSLLQQQIVVNSKSELEAEKLASLADEDAHLSRASRSLQRLSFSSKQTEDEDEPEELRRTLVKVSLDSASGLHTGGLEKPSNSYCICHIDGERERKRFQTDVCQETSEPAWKHEHTFDACSYYDELAFEVWNQRTGEEDELLGRAVLFHAQFREAGFFEGQLSVIPPQLRRISFVEETVKGGSLKVRVDCLPIDKLQHGPRLFVTVIAANDLELSDAGSSVDPYCVCTMAGNSTWRYETKPAGGTVDPLWQEDMEVDGYIEGDCILNFNVWDHDQGSGNGVPLGTVTLENFMFEERGFEGSLHLIGAGAGPMSELMVRVELS